jgi:hypothetical protein
MLSVRAECSQFATPRHLCLVSYRGEENGRYIYSIGNLSPYGGFDLPLLYKKLNQVEDLQGNDVWGGSDNCGGSPRERGSSLCPHDLVKFIWDFQCGLVSRCAKTRLKTHQRHGGWKQNRGSWSMASFA